MYFWNIDKLTEQLISGELSEHEQFKYLMANSILYALAVIQYEVPNQLDTWCGIIGIFITILGLWFTYKCNGGPSGKNIIQRYLSVSFIVLIRITVLFMLPAIIAASIIQEFYLSGIPEETTMSSFILIIISEGIFVLWVAKQINFIAKHTNA